MCALQPPLDEVPEEDWYCELCIVDGKARTLQQQKAAQGKVPTPGKRYVARNRALAAMLNDDEDSDVDAAVTVKVINQSDRWDSAEQPLHCLCPPLRCRESSSAAVPRPFWGKPHGVNRCLASCLPLFIATKRTAAVTAVQVY